MENVASSKALWLYIVITVSDGSRVLLTRVRVDGLAPCHRNVHDVVDTILQ